jgi:hypothetical protein
VKIFDPQFAIRLARLLQARGTNVEAPQDVPFAGLVITIPGEAVLENAGGPALRATGIVNAILVAPVAGAEFEQVIPAGEAWHPLVFFYRLVTNATAVTRYPALIIDNNSAGQPFYRDEVTSGQPASETWDYSWGLGSYVRENTGLFRSVRPFPDVVLTQGMRFRVNVANMQAGDDVSVVSMIYERAAYR